MRFRYSVVPHGTGASKIASVFTNDLQEAHNTKTKMLQDGADSVMVWDEQEGKFL